MGLFAPHKRHANKFNYIPRYYDPAKEAREQRRAELCGQRLDEADQPYVPGQYIRTQREAREARRTAEGNSGRTRIVRLAALALALIFLTTVLYPRIVALVVGTKRTPMTSEKYFGDFDPSAPITIVPNDYQEE